MSIVNFHSFENIQKEFLDLQYSYLFVFVYVSFSAFANMP